LIPKRSYAGGNYLLRPAGKSLVISAANLNFRQPYEYLVKNQPEYFCVSLYPGSLRAGVGGARIDKEKIYRQHIPTGFAHRGLGVLFLPEFFDTFLNSRHGISPEEIVLAIDALGKFPLIPDASVILKQIGEASFSGNIGSLWLEAKTLELVAIILDWYRRRSTMTKPGLKEDDQAGIAEEMRYAADHCSGPLTLEILAKQAAMSISKFTAAFKIHTGISAASYIRRIRMDKAMDLLKNTSAPLGDIAGMVGYKYHSRFSTLFKEQFGLAPGLFRKKD
jgi:AraC-like DNA-binding protein